MTPKSRTTATDARTIVARAAGLASLPEVAARVVALAEDPNATASQFEAVIGRDPALAARLLRIANSPYYSVTGQIDTIARAVTMVGTRHIRDLTLGLAAIRAFAGIPVELVSMEDFWVHSLYCAHLSRALSADDLRMADTVFVGGLLHDIGQLLLFIQQPEESRVVHRLAPPAGARVTRARPGGGHRARGELAGLPRRDRLHRPVHRPAHPGTGGATGAVRRARGAAHGGREPGRDGGAARGVRDMRGRPAAGYGGHPSYAGCAPSVSSNASTSSSCSSKIRA